MICKYNYGSTWFKLQPSSLFRWLVNHKHCSPPLLLPSANPVCDEVGCGQWEAPMIQNPNYRGKWKPELIENAEYDVRSTT